MGEFILTDYIFIIIVFLSTLFGFARGFTRELFTFINLGIAAAATYFAYPYSYEFFANNIKNELAIQGCAIVIPFIVFWIIIIITNSFVLDSLGSMKGTMPDRLLGTVLGIVRGAVIVGGIYLTSVQYYEAQEDKEKLGDWIKNASTFSLAKMSGEMVLAVLPEKSAECYTVKDACSITKLTEDLQRRVIYAVSEERLIAMGMSAENIAALNIITRDLPDSYGTKYTVDEIAAFGDAALIRDYGQALLADYDKALRDGKVEPNVSKEALDNLKTSFENLKDLPQTPETAEKPL